MNSRNNDNFITGGKTLFYSLPSFTTSFSFHTCIWKNISQIVFAICFVDFCSNPSFVFNRLFFQHILHYFSSITYFSIHLSLFFKFRSPFFCCFFCLLTELNCFWFFIDIFQLDTYTFFLSFLSHPNVYCSNICMTCPPFMPVWRRKKGPRCVLGVGIHSRVQ